MSKLITGHYLTPFKLDGQSFSGAVYDSTLRIVEESLRDCVNTAIRHDDPFYLLHSSIGGNSDHGGRFMYLGHYFPLYGHFLLETLPMLHALIDRKQEKGLFLPWHGFRDRNLLDYFLDLLQIPRTNVDIYHDQDILRADLLVIPRPIALNYRLYSSDPYRDIINRLRHNLDLGARRTSGRLKYFLSRRSNRVSESHSLFVQGVFENHGYIAVRPEELEAKEQLRIFFTADEIAGFSGSQMHNSIFCASSSLVIVIGDNRDSCQLQVNQRLCGEISGARTVFIPYTHDKDHFSEMIGEVISNSNAN